MSGISNPGAGGPIFQITGSGGIVITNPYGPVTNVDGSGIGPGPGACAGLSPVYGSVEVATLAQTFGQVYAGATCPLAVSPSYLPFNEELISGAHFSNFSSPVWVAGGFGTYAVDIQPFRTAPGNIAAGASSIAIGQDNAALFANDVAIGQSNISSAIRGITHGSTNRCYASNGLAVGYRNVAGMLFGLYDGSMAIGRSNFGRANASIACGILNNVTTPANLNDTTGAIIGDPQTLTYSNAINSGCWGHANTIIYGSIRSHAFGFKNRIGTPMGLANQVDGVAVGNFNVLYGSVGVGASSAVGFTNVISSFLSHAFGNNNIILGPMNLVLGSNCYCGYGGRCVLIGYNAYVSGVSYANAIGRNARVTATYATALGDEAVNRVDATTNIAGPVIIRMDNGEGLAAAFKQFAGAEVIIMTPEIDLTAIADYLISLPANCHFWWNEAGVILTELTGLITSQPTVQFGINGTPAKYLAPVLTTLLTAVLKRERYQTLLQDDGEVDLLFGVTVGAVVGTSMSGRAYFKGLLKEDD